MAKCKCGESKSSAFYPSRRNKCRKCIDDNSKATRTKRDAADTALRVRVNQHGSTLEGFGSEMERACVEAIRGSSSIVAAAESLGIEPRTLRAHMQELERRAATRGWAPGSDMTKPTPLGFHVKGVSTYYSIDKETGESKPSGQWIKTKRDEQERYTALLDAMSTIGEEWKGLAEPSAAPKIADEDLLCVYPMGDPHLGMLAWCEETGANFDVGIAERNLCAAVDHLVSLAPPAETGLLVDLGDFFHADNKAGTTSKGTRLDTDGRWAKVWRAGIRTVRRLIDRMLTKHKRVHVIIEIGNHDDHSSILLALCLAQYYENEPRVFIDTSPEKFHWYRFGLNLIGVTHGDTAKFTDLPQIMAVDRAQDWGETKHRYWYCGHVHHDSLKEFPGCTVETFRTLAPSDDWHRRSGYRSGRDMKLDVLHRKHGRINRHTVGIEQIAPTNE